MRNTKSLVLVTSLALAAAEGEMAKLDPKEVPVQCATICGPVVELTGICHIGSHEMAARRLKRRRLEDQHQQQHVRMHKRSPGARHQHPYKKQKRQFVTNAFGQVVPIPSNAADGNGGDPRTVTVTRTAGGAAATGTAGGSSPSRIIPTDGLAGAAETDPAGDDADAGDDVGIIPPGASVTPIAVGNAIEGDGADVADPVSSGALQLASGSSGMDDMYTHKKESEEIEQAEEDCTCLNDSFDVALVSGLCQSCITQAGYGSSMEIIMSQCNFTGQVYDPSKDSVTNNIRVKAERPQVAPGIDNALISDSPPSPALTNGFMGAVFAGFACGIAVFL